MTPLDRTAAQRVRVPICQVEVLPVCVFRPRQGICSDFDFVRLANQEVEAMRLMVESAADIPKTCPARKDLRVSWGDGDVCTGVEEGALVRRRTHVSR